VTMRLRRDERVTIIADLVYLAMAAFVAWGRFGPGSFTSRSDGRLDSLRARPAVPGSIRAQLPAWLSAGRRVGEQMVREGEENGGAAG
jgi:hypothetical protein